MNNSIIIILGPTASGKSEFSLSLAKKLNGEIISADSMQVYKHMNIGTAKPPCSQRKAVPHHFISIINPDEDFSAGKFKRKAERVIDRILNKKKVPIVVGGTGLYIRTLTDGLCESPPENKKIRRELESLAKKHGNPRLHSMLKKVDAVAAENIHHNNLRRIIRALEVYKASGIPFSEWHKRMEKPGYRFRMFGLSRERAVLYGRINDRVDRMFKRGFVNEVKRLIRMGYGKNLHSMQSIGYKHVVEYLENKYDYATLVELVKRDTRRYSKRQMTWWNKDSRIQWINGDSAQLSRKVCQ